ncbi:MAG: hypothetical protein C0424_07285 [Sphingobacteriaceae bacterium]|nr:hypothetical protein [Sphingobacteriaceae bacterium]
MLGKICAKVLFFALKRRGWPLAVNALHGGLVMSRSFGTVNGLWPGNVPQVRAGEALRAGVARNP